MGIKMIKKIKENSNEIFDFSMVGADARKFDFARVQSDLQLFRVWLETLQDKVDTPTPKIWWGKRTDIGYLYHIANRANGNYKVDIDIICGTNPTEFPEFRGKIRAGAKDFKIADVTDLTLQLIDDIVAAVKDWVN